MFHILLKKRKEELKKSLDNLKSAYYDDSKLSFKQQLLNELEKDFNAQMYK